MRLPRNLLSPDTYAKPRIFLCETDKSKITQLDTLETKASFKFNSYSELSFEVARIYNDLTTGDTKINPYYSLIEAPRLIFIEDFGYFEIQSVELVSDGIKESKNITANSLEYSLSTKYLEDFYINTGEIGSVEVTYSEANGTDIVPVTLYNPTNTNLSLLHLVLAKDYGFWQIGHVDSSLQTLSRQFSIDRQSIYDFIMNEICEKFNCYVVFDTIDNTINIYAESLTSKFIADGITNTFAIFPPFSDVGTVSINGYKTTMWNYNSTTGILTLNDIPESGSHIEVVDGALTKWETDVFVTFDNLAQEISIDYSADDIKTVLTVTYGDDSDIREANLGLSYITDLSYYCTPDWMGQDLYNAYMAYQTKCNARQVEYANNAQEILKFNNHIWFEENRLSLGYSVVNSVGPDTVGKYYIRGGEAPDYYYKEVSLPSEYNASNVYYSINTANLNESKVRDLYSVLKKYFNNENEDKSVGSSTITSWKTDIDKLAEDFEFMDSYTLNNLSSVLSSVTNGRIGNSTVEGAINRFLDLMWNEIGRTPLKYMYYESYKKIQTTNIESGWSQTSSEKYGYYYPVVLYIKSIERAIAERDNSIARYESQRSVFQNANLNISNGLLMSNNFTNEQLIRLNPFLREDELHLDNIVDTEQDSLADSFKVKQDAIESGRIELNKICQPRLQFSMSMANLYALKEFEPIVDQFQLGKVIKVGLRQDYIKQSRLLQVDVNFDDFSDFACEFGELTSVRSQSDIHADLLANAISAGKSVATNSSYWTRGSEQAGVIQQNIDAGLLDAVTSIKAMDGTQGVEIDKYGIHLQNINPNTGEVDPEQGWITSNKFLYTDDGFKSTKSVFGKYTYNGNTYYGILAEALVGKVIVGTNIEIENSNGTLKFNDEGFSVTNGSTSFKVDPNTQNLINMSNGTEDIFYLDNDGKLHVVGDGNDLDISTNSTVSEIKKTEDAIKLSVTNEVQRATQAENGLQTSINEASAQITLNKDSIASEVKNRQEITNDLYVKISDANTKIEQTEDNITLSVNNVKQYVDDNYSTTTEMNSAISQSASNITSTVSQTLTGYATVGQAKHYGTCPTRADTAEKLVVCSGFTLYTGATISVNFTYKNSAANPTLNVNSTGAKYIRAYNNNVAADSSYNWAAKSIVTFVFDGSWWRIADSGALYQTKDLSSQITQTANDITAEVTRAKAAEYELSSKITINANAITSKVSSGDFGTLIEQNYNHVKIAWNKNSNYIQFENGAMNIYTSSTRNNNTLLMKQNYNGSWYYHSGSTIGKIGTNKWTSNDNYRGLVFDLEYSAGYMCWAQKNSTTASSYTVKLVYHSGHDINGNSTTSSIEKAGLHFACDTYANGYLYLNDNVKLFHHKNGSAGLYAMSTSNSSTNGKGVYIDAQRTDGKVTRFACFSDKFEFSGSTSGVIDVHGNSIINQSDARLKTNIQNTQIDALSVINQVKMKEFDWIEDGTHEDIGIIAQQLQAVLPDLVHEDASTGKLSIKFIKFIPYLIKAIQELTEYIVGDVSTFSFCRDWVDNYTEEEKNDFVAKLATLVQENEIIPEPILIPIEQKGEEEENE